MTEFIYLHGLASGPCSKKASAFKKKFKEIGLSLNIPDLEGANFECMTLTSQVDIIINLLNRLQSKKVCLIGSSMGGYLATLIAQQRDEIVAIYLMAPGFNFFERWVRNFELDYGNENRWLTSIPIYHYRYEETKYISTNIFRNAKVWDNIDLNKELPSRIIHGIHDSIVPIIESRKFVSSHPWFSLKELDTDHGLLSCLEWIMDDCIGFFKKLGYTAI
jgi:uncharacterized protein